MKCDHNVVHVRGIYRRGGEISGFYDARCIGTDSAWVDWSPELKQHSSPSIVSTVDEMLDTDGRATIDAVVEFDGPKPAEIRPEHLLDSLR
jgi:hypothetical protein